MRRAAVLVTVGLLLLGGRCTPLQAPTAIVFIDPPTIQVQPFTTFSVDVVVTTSTPIQSFEFDIAVDPALALPYAAVPHPDFDDDGQLFIEPTADIGTGRLHGVVDLRHGPPGKTGTFRIATIYLWSQNTGQSPLYPESGGLADENASSVGVSVIPATLSVAP